MTPLPPVITGLIGSLSGGDKSQSLLLSSPSQNFKDGLKINEVVTGSVNRNLGDGKYAIQLRGESLVMESSTPLKTNELIHGRVVGIGDKVELQRVFKEKAAADKQGIQQQNLQHLYQGGKEGFRAAEVLQNYRVSLSADEQLALMSMLKSHAETEAIALTAVVLSKMGMPVSTSSLATLYPVLSTSLKDKFNLQNITAHIDFDTDSGATVNSKTISELSAFIASMVNELPEAQLKNEIKKESDDIKLDAENSDFNSEEGNANSQSDAFLFDARRMLLNSQSDGSVSHRVAVIPFVINEKLIEVDVALFSQKNQVKPDSINYKKIVLSLNLDMLGKVDVEISLANKHARIKMNTEKNIITDEMVKYMPDLKNDLLSQKIKIDELSYETAITDNLGNVISSVVDHYVTQDSLSRVY